MSGISGSDLWLMVQTGWLTFTVNYAMGFWGETPFHRTGDAAGGEFMG